MAAGRDRLEAYLPARLAFSTPFKLRPTEEPGEGAPPARDEKKPEREDHEGEDQAGAVEKDVKKQNVDDDRAEDGEPERDEAPEQEEQTTQDLAKANGVDVTAAEKRVEEIAHGVMRQLGHRHEMEERVQAEDDEGESKEQADE